jgi:anti-sigma B factor antagonist
MEDTPQFRAELLWPFDDLAVVELEGEIDIFTSPPFYEAITEGIGQGARRVIVDLVKVSFIDSTALGVVVAGVRNIKAQGGTLDVACSQQNIRGVFETTGLDRILGVYCSLAEALAASQQ